MTIGKSRANLSRLLFEESRTQKYAPVAVFPLDSEAESDENI